MAFVVMLLCRCCDGVGRVLGRFWEGVLKELGECWEGLKKEFRWRRESVEK